MKRLIGPSCYEDAYQDGCLAVLEAIRYFDPENGVYFSKYVQMKVNYCFLEKGRFYQAQGQEASKSLDTPLSGAPDAATLAEVVPDPAQGAPEQLIQSEEYRLLYRLLAELPEKYRSVLTAHYFEDLSMAEIARRLKRSPNTVST